MAEGITLGLSDLSKLSINVKLRTNNKGKTKMGSRLPAGTKTYHLKSKISKIHFRWNLSSNKGLLDLKMSKNRIQKL